LLRGGGISSSVIRLRAHAFATQARDRVGGAVARTDEAAAFELFEKRERAVGETMAVAVEAVDFDDTRRVARVQNASALREHMHHALFQS